MDRQPESIKVLRMIAAEIVRIDDEAQNKRARLAPKKLDFGDEVETPAPVQVLAVTRNAAIQRTAHGVNKRRIIQNINLARRIRGENF